MATPDPILSNKVMHPEFASLTILDGNVLGGPWRAACLSSHTGPTWVYVDTEGNIVPLSSVLVAWTTDHHST